MPVEITTLGAFIVAASALVMSPGPDTLLILRYTLSSGQRVGLATVIGVQLGLMVHTLLAVAGISLIIASSPVLFKTVAILGAAYLAWLGVQGFAGGGSLRLESGSAPVGAGKACRDAILCNVLNPKVIMLFLALLPNFIDVDRGDVTAQLIFLAATLIVINVLWQAPMAWLADIVRHWLNSPGVQVWVARITGVILLGFAFLMIYEHLA